MKKRQKVGKSAIDVQPASMVELRVAVLRKALQKALEATSADGAQQWVNVFVTVAGGHG